MSPKLNEAYIKRKKIALLQAAKKVFIQKGYTRTTMQDIMNQAGISRGALYAYFNNIEHVYIELLQLEDQEDIQLFDPDDTGTCWEQLTKWAQQHQQQIETIDQSLLLANSEFFLSSYYREHQERHPHLTLRYERIVAAITALIERGALTGEFHPRLAAESIARYMISFVDGLMLDTFHLGVSKTMVADQMNVLLVSLRKLLGVAE